MQFTIQPKNNNNSKKKKTSWLYIYFNLTKLIPSITETIEY